MPWATMLAVTDPERCVISPRIHPMTKMPTALRQTLASYRSMHPSPDSAASAGHLVSGPLGGLVAPAEPANSVTATVIAIPFEKMSHDSLLGLV